MKKSSKNFRELTKKEKLKRSQNNAVANEYATKYVVPGAIVLAATFAVSLILYLIAKA